MPIAAHTVSTSQKVTEPTQDQARTKKSRVIRRRARARELVDSDEEIEREVGTDSGTDGSSLDSDTESDSELASDDVLPRGRYSVVTPSTTQSPQPLDIDDATPFNGGASSKADLPNGSSSFFVSTAVDWSEMVAEEHRNGPTELPVIDFADLGSHPIDLPVAPRSHKSQKAGKRPVAPRTKSVPGPDPVARPRSAFHQSDDNEPRLEDGSRQEDEPKPEEVPSSYYPSRDSFQRRPPGPTARQAYQQRLESDPSYVPVVGEFWGHDDRLLDKELRSLSGWWRGRWQGRGRGRGGFGMRGRGRGGLMDVRPAMQSPSTPKPDGEAEVDSGPAPQVPPIEQPWTHDGFEDMKRREEQRRAVREQQHTRGFTSLRGFVPGRGRGGFFRGFVPSPIRSRSNLSMSTPHDRPRFASKPEQSWTKRHEAFLYYDDRGLRPRPGQGQGYRIKFPGDRRRGMIVRGPPRSFSSPRRPKSPVVSTSVNLDDEDKVCNVRLPTSAGEKKAEQVDVPFPLQDSTNHSGSSLPVVDPIDDSGLSSQVVSLTIATEEISASRAPHAPNAAGETMGELNQEVTWTLPRRLELSASSQPFTPSQHMQVFPEQILAQQSAQNGEHDTNDYTLWQDDAEMEGVEAAGGSSAGQRPTPPVLPPLQTVFSPMSQSSPTFGSPYGYPQALPPGIAMSQHGMPYELATGRPVYLQGTPPPPMYNPRPVLHPHIIPPPISFVPGHTPHHSMASPDFFTHSPSPSMNGFIDPSTGAPLFTLPRQSSRVEIRPPSDQSERKSTATHRPSNLRIAVDPGFSDSANTSLSQQSDHADSAGDAASPATGEFHNPYQQAVDPAMMAYNPYQHQYYYPEQYGGSPYMDMSHMGPYEMFPVDNPPPQQAVYY